MRLLRRAIETVRVLAQVRRERRVPYLPEPEVRQIRDRRLRDTVAHAYQTVPYYRETMARLGLTPADFRSADDLVKLPFISKQEVGDDPERFRSTAVDQSTCLARNTTGSLGPRTSFLHDPAAMLLNLACAGRETEAITRAVGRPLLGLRVATFMRPGFTADVTRRFYRAQAFLPVRRLTLKYEDPLEETVARLNRFRPDVITGLGNETGLLFRFFLEGRVRFPLPKAIVYGGDPFPEGVRTRLEREHGIPVFSCYGAAEIPRIGFTCEERRGLHLHTDLSHVRIVGEDGSDVRVGAGELVVSNLTNRATVLLNYRIGDHGSFAERACSCGRTLPLLNGFIGRHNEVIVFPNGRYLFRSDLHRVFRPRNDVLEYQVVQTAEAVLAARVVPSPDADFARLEREVQEGFKPLIGDDVRVNVERVAAVERQPGGKVKFIAALPGS